jgi:UDP-N-acetylmuramyl tripeptide synthase
MPYIVQAAESEDHSAVSKTHADRKEALVTAVKWASEGRTVKIIGNGQIYTVKELAQAIIADE